MQTIDLYCDGACSNLGGLRANHAGWASIIVFGDIELITTGHCYPATNSVAELKALISGLERIIEPCRIEFYSDAQYIVKGVNIWLDNWIERDFRKVENSDLWKEIAGFRKLYPLHGNWIRGHAKKGERSAHQEMNVRCDELAVEEAWKSYKEVTGKEQGE